jgi:hypothetical protein
MSDDQKNNLPIKYTSREFSSIREDLLELVERFYPENFQDFSEASFGAMMLDATAYVADQMALYIDFNVNESFLDTSFQLENVLRHGRVLGYKDPGRPSTTGIASMFVLVPASSTGMGPDPKYIPIASRGTSFTTNTGLAFILTDNIDFNDPSNEVVVARVDNTTGAPTHYAIKANGNVISGRFGQKEITIGAYERFKKVSLSATNLSEIVSVFDQEGNEYFEVEYLSQDMVFKEIPNINFKNDNVPSIIKPLLVSRKFVVERTRNGVVLQFGSGDPAESNVVAQPQSVAMNAFGKSYTSDTSFDPTRLSKNNNFGIVPVNTTLTVLYRSTNPSNSNVAVGNLNKVNNARLKFNDESTLSPTSVSQIINSFEVSNETPIVGDVSNPSTTEIKRRIYDTFPTQNRAVTQSDYESIAYRMSPKYGSVKRVSVQKDPDSLKRNLNMYVISEDSFKKLISSNNTIKNNLKTWLNDYRMINDTIDILDAHIINIGIDVMVKPVSGVSRADALDDSLKIIKSIFEEGFFIGEHMYISDIYSKLKESQSILDVITVKINSKTGGEYSNIKFDINSNTSPDGTYLICPKNAIFEIKYPDVDVRGKVR